jgi:electron transport complex protein RnfD
MTAPLVSAPFARGSHPVRAIMLKVVLALSPATAFGWLIFGWPTLFLFAVTVAASLAFEALCLALAGRPARATLADGSALLTGWLIAMSLPPWAPWWVGALGAFIAIVVGKQVYGGIGQNLFNPAMLARVALLVSFPLEMTTWVMPSPPFSSAAPGFLGSLAITFGGQIPVDGHTGASIIGHIKTEFSQGRSLSQALLSGDYGFLSDFFGSTNGSAGETSGFLLLLGGLYLLRERIITWHIPLAYLGTVALASTLFTLLDGERYPDPWFHLSSGALVLGAFFIATDYVTSPNSPVGQVIFGAGCGLVTFVIRTWGTYPEGVGFAVLLMNSLTPVIDHYLRPRIYGRDHKGRPLELPESGP